MVLQGPEVLIQRDFRQVHLVIEMAGISLLFGKLRSIFDENWMHEEFPPRGPDERDDFNFKRTG